MKPISVTPMELILSRAVMRAGEALHSPGGVERTHRILSKASERWLATVDPSGAGNQPGTQPWEVRGAVESLVGHSPQELALFASLVETRAILRLLMERDLLATATMKEISDCVQAMSHAIDQWVVA